MSNDKSKFSKEEKAKIALQAVSGDEETIKKLSGKYEVSADEIMEWAVELGIVKQDEVSTVESNVIDPGDDNDVEIDVADDEFTKEINFGAAFDKLKMGRLTFWTIFGTFLVLTMIIGIMEVYDYTISTNQRNVAEQSTFYEISELKEKDNETLNTFGVVDSENGIYRIPIDSAISITAKEFE